jgi:hypothetical protein
VKIQVRNSATRGNADPSRTSRQPQPIASP